MSIFVQLTSYKNFDTVPTVLDCISKASDPAGLRFGIVLQQDEDIPAELNMPGVALEKCSVAESRGPGWAKSVAQGMYGSEDYVLQIESGSRFAQGWDSSLISALNSTGSQKPVIGNVPNKFNPANGEMEVPGCSYRLQAHMFVDNVPSCWYAPMKGITQIQPARILGDNFYFSVGSHSKECRHDPVTYWAELDASLTLRSFTRGYDLFNHFVPTVWSDYSPRPRHWDDRSDWWIGSRASSERFADLVAGKIFGEHGLGTARSLKDYELHSGVDFAGRRLHRDVFSGKNPPVAQSYDASWDKAFGKDYSFTVSWRPEDIERCDDYDFWQFAVQDAAAVDIFKQDLRPDREPAMLGFKVNYRKVALKAFDGRVPTTFSIHPFSKSRGQLKKSVFRVDSSV